MPTYLWAVTERDIHLEAHINLAEDVTVSKTCLLGKQIEEILHARFDIDHVPLQFEYEACQGVSLIKS